MVAKNIVELVKAIETAGKGRYRDEEVSMGKKKASIATPTAGILQIASVTD